jgi:hypothetical protein
MSNIINLFIDKEKIKSCIDPKSKMLNDCYYFATKSKDVNVRIQAIKILEDHYNMVQQYQQNKKIYDKRN